jgi:hypothetical protein
MSRARNIKPGFFINVELGELEPITRLLFIGLWTVADREGRLKDQPKKIKVQILPYDECDIDKLLNNLEEAGFIIRYSVGQCSCIQIVNFNKHQNPHHQERDSEIPAPDNNEIKPEVISDKSRTNPADSLNLIPDSLNPSTSSENSFSDDSLEMKMTKFMIDKILESYPGAKVPKTENQIYKWALAFNRLMRIDKRTVDDIRTLMKWVYQEEFWSTNIRSPDKLREKWDTLWLQMQRINKASDKPEPLEHRRL